jgi:predicted RNase H-like nuclease (RuvC/YqgF family)
MDIEKLIERLNRYFEGKDLKRGVALDAATALSALQAENKKLRAELEQVKRCIEIVENQRDQVKRERDAAIDCIYKIEDALDRGNDNDWAREHILEWESQKD